MIQHTEAVFEGGVLRPLSPLQLAENARVVVSVADASECAPGDLSLAEFDKLLDELSADHPLVTGNFSRAEIYADHD